jgi:hypothetical protein
VRFSYSPSLEVAIAAAAFPLSCVAFPQQVS